MQGILAHFVEAAGERALKQCQENLATIAEHSDWEADDRVHDSLLRLQEEARAPLLHEQT